jgi:hypothetical protein
VGGPKCALRVVAEDAQDLSRAVVRADAGGAIVENCAVSPA